MKINKIDLEAGSHATAHQNTGADEINVAGLSGELADAQPPKAHSLGGDEHNADTLANLNAKVSGATLDDSGAKRDPNDHAHQAVGVGGKLDHGLALNGLDDDDHTQYYNSERHTKAVHDALAIDHGSLSGTDDDDHSQYALKSLFDADTILKSDVDNTPTALPILEQQLVGRLTAGSITGLTSVQVKTLLAIAIADISDIPSTIASILTDHDKTAHDALGINAGQVDGIEGVDILQRDGSVPLTANWPIGDGKLLELNSAPSTDLTATGVATDSQTAGENLVFGNLIYLNSDGKWWKTNADAAATTEGILGIALGTINAEATGKILLHGFIRDDTWTLTVGQWLYVGLAGGDITATHPSGAGDQSRRIGAAFATSIIFFNPDGTTIEI